ncbi:MAG: ribokinase [Actinobacteria bacterium]|nr:ribokinase [Actinomycetota bacterium]
MSSRVVVVGSSNMDLVAFMDTIPVAGETKSGRSFQQSFGGKGANQAVAAARCGVPVSIITGLGKDSNGSAMLENFAAQGVDTESSFEFDVTTGVAHIWVEESGENRIVLIPGANHSLVASDVVAKFNAISDVAVVVGQCEIPLDVTVAVFAAARKRGVVTIMNPAPWQELPTELLGNVDWLVVNEVEHSELRPGSYLGNLVVTLGSKGAELIMTDGTRIKFDAPKVKAIDTTGAGDCLIGTFAAALSRGDSPQDALQLGIQRASESVTKVGAQSSY